MRRSRLGIAPALALLALLAGGVPSALGLPVAVDRVQGNGIGPDSPLYGLERAGERIQLLMAMDHSANAKINLDLATERLDEMEREVGAGRSAHVNDLVQEYEKHAKNAMAEAELSGKADVVQIITEAVSKHGEVLSRVYQSAPEQAKSDLERAIDNSNVTRVITEAMAKRPDNLSQEKPVLPEFRPDEGQGAGMLKPAEGNADRAEVPSKVPVDAGADKVPKGVVEERELPQEPARGQGR